jgi:hypothetical protein
VPLVGCPISIPVITTCIVFTSFAICNYLLWTRITAGIVIALVQPQCGEQFNLWADGLALRKVSTAGREALKIHQIPPWPNIDDEMTSEFSR